MGRKPVNRKAMTDAERQRRRRKRLRAEKLKLGRQAEKERCLLKAAEDYIPMPPGITYWVRVRVGDRDVLQPTTHPLPSVSWHELRDEDLYSLIDQARRELERRGWPERVEPPPPVETDTVMVSDLGLLLPKGREPGERGTP
jgi:hypothetical protein